MAERTPAAQPALKQRQLGFKADTDQRLLYARIEPSLGSRE